jgi:hypothetical protein
VHGGALLTLGPRAGQARAGSRVRRRAAPSPGPHSGPKPAAWIDFVGTRLGRRCYDAGVPGSPSSVAAAAVAFVAFQAACVPEGPSTADARPSPPKLGAAAAPARPAEATKPAVPGAQFEDGFERAEIGPEWNALSPKWRITNGRLCARGVRNHGIWLRRTIPTNARIEFDAYAESAEGDLKAELWGDGASGATGVSYSNATSYLTILGGWKNSRHVLARLDEHGADRLELDVEPGSDDERARPVEVGQAYHFKIERVDGRTLEWSVNGLVFFRLPDAEPLAGPGHDHFGFNEWDAPVCFDNVKVTPL